MKNKNIINTILILSIIILPLTVKAEENVSSLRSKFKGDIKTERESFREDVKNQRASTTPEELKKLRENSKIEMNKVRKDFQTTIKTNRASTTEAIKTKRTDLINNIQEKREIFKDELALIREKRASTTAEIKAKFKENLQKIKDENKKIKLENTSDSLISLNTKLTDLASKNVDKIETVLIAIESRIDKATVNNIDVSKIRVLIATAETSISNARAAIATQAAKVYTINIITEENAKSEAKKTRDLLKSDIKIMNDKMKAAHESVKNTADALKLIPKINTPIATSTATTTSN